jgi:hypothetical protein
MLEIQVINNISFIPTATSLKNLTSPSAHEKGKKNST